MVPLVLTQIHSVKATAEDSVYILDITYEVQGVPERDFFVSRPDDEYGFGPEIRQWLQDNQANYQIQPYVAPEPDDGPYQISKTTPWRRMTDNEAAIMDATMAETTARTKQIYMAAQYLSSDDELWTTLHTIIADAFGSARADELLAPEA